MSKRLNGMCIPIANEKELCNILDAIAMGYISELLNDINQNDEKKCTHETSNHNNDECDNECDNVCCDNCCPNCCDDCDNTDNIDNMEIVGVTIENVLYYDPATIVCWSDGTKTKVVCEKSDTYNPTAGLALACIKKMLGNKSFHQLLIDWNPETIGVHKQLSKKEKIARQNARKAKTIKSASSNEKKTETASSKKKTTTTKSSTAKKTTATSKAKKTAPKTEVKKAPTKKSTATAKKTEKTAE